ncbi:uncharacterized protein LOC108666303 isoform X2 [Hyalella azteca]|uniref:Uncharacterized protein LOC108666303 isoform X2 n=1 Tax=Hyalella azteca TaxID=294128 RepID=A0A8B7N470_HYAAZ|nr:uncharacterized protein LOC108666303 isoform X2 [Hyalella azteca]
MSQSLPIHISVETVTNNPQLGQLLESLTEHLTPTAVRSSTQQHLNNATAALKHARLAYMEQAALSHYMLSAIRSTNAPNVLQPIEDLYALAELTGSLKLPFKSQEATTNSDHNSNTDDTPPLTAMAISKTFNSSTHSHISSESSSHNSYAGLSSLMNCSKSSNMGRLADNSTHSSSDNICSCCDNKPCSEVANALKYKPEKVRDPVTYKLCSPKTLTEKAARLCAGSRISSLLAQHTSDRIVTAWQKIRSCILLPDDSAGEETAVPRLLSLSDQCCSSARLLHSSCIITHVLLLQVDGQLVEYGTLLSDLVKKRRLSQLPYHNLLHLCTALHTQHHKLRCVELQILCRTYTPSVMAGLRGMSLRLQDRSRIASQELAKLQHDLEPYTHLDPSYLALLDEYNKLKADIKFCTSART